MPDGSTVPPGIVRSVIGAAILVNAVPHGAHALACTPFPSPFADPPGRGLSSPTQNAIWSGANALAGVVLLRGHLRTRRQRAAAVVSGAAAAIALAIYFAPVVSTHDGTASGLR